MSRIEEAQRRLAEAAPGAAARRCAHRRRRHDRIAGGGAVSGRTVRSIGRRSKAQAAKPQAAATPALAAASQPHHSAARQAELRAAERLIELINEGLSRKVVIDGAMMPVSREQYRRLAATLHHAQEDRGIKVVMISSAMPGEGKTLTAANLALTFSESYRRIGAAHRRRSASSVAAHGVQDRQSTGLSDGLEAVPKSAR